MVKSFLLDGFKIPYRYWVLASDIVKTVEIQERRRLKTPWRKLPIGAEDEMRYGRRISTMS